MGAFEAGVAVGKQEFGMAVGLPEPAQHQKRRLRQWHEAIPVALGVAYLYAPAVGIDVAHLEGQPLAQAQTEAIEGEVEDSVAEHPGGQKQALRFVDRDDVRQTLRLRRFDQVWHGPGFLEHVQGEEFEAVESWCQV